MDKKMKKLLIVALIASLGLVSCSAPKNLRPEHKEVYSGMNGPDGRRFLKMDPAQQDEFLALRTLRQEINRKAWNEKWPREESQKIRKFGTRKELQDFYATTSKKYSTTESVVVKEIKSKDFNSLAKKHGVTCVGAPYNLTMNLNKLARVHNLNKKQTDELRELAQAFADAQRKNLNGNQYIRSTWNSTCEKINKLNRNLALSGLEIGTYDVAGSVLKSFAETMIGSVTNNKSYEK